MIKLAECNRDNFCVDCDSDCIGAGKVESDCPKWKCTENIDCEKCTFMKGYYAEMRKGSGSDETD